MVATALQPNVSVGMKILVIEDDREAAAYLVKGLEESGYVVDHAATGTDGQRLPALHRRTSPASALHHPGPGPGI